MGHIKDLMASLLKVSPQVWLAQGAVMEGVEPIWQALYCYFRTISAGELLRHDNSCQAIKVPLLNISLGLKLQWSTCQLVLLFPFPLFP